MKTLTKDEFAEIILSMPAPEGPFQPTATYDPDGDCIEFIIKDDDFYAHRMDDLVTVYYSEKDNQLVGAFVKSIKSFCKKFMQRSPYFAVVVEKPPVRLSCLFVARLMELEGQANKQELRVAATVYQELITQAEQKNVEIPREACCTA